MPSTASNRQSVKPATLVSLSGSPEALTTHLGLLPSSPNVLVLPPINVPSFFAPNSPPASGSNLNARELVTTVHSSYIQRHAQAEAFTTNHPSRGVILQKGWTVLLAECAQQLVDAGVCADANEAVAIIKEICDGGVEDIEKEEEFEIEIEDPELDEKTPVIEEEPESADGDGDVVPVINPRVSQLSHSSSSSSASSRSRRRTSERSFTNPNLHGNSIDETAELEFPTRDSSLPDSHHIPLVRSRSSQSLRDGLRTPLPGSSPNPTGTTNRNSSYNGKGGKRFPVKAASMENMAGIAGLGLSLTGTPSYRDSIVSARDSLISNRDSIFVAERRRILEERLAEDRTRKMSTELSENEVDDILARKRSTLSSRASSQRSSLPSSSPRTSSQSFDSRSSTPTRMLEEPKKRTRKVMEKRTVVVKKTYPTLVFPKEDVVLFLQNSETSPTTTMLVDSFANAISPRPGTPFTPSNSVAGYPSPPLSPVAPPTIVIEQVTSPRVSSRSSSPALTNRSSSPVSAPKLSLFPSGRKSALTGVDGKAIDTSTSELKKKMEVIKEQPTKTKKVVIHSSSSVKRIDVEGSTPLKVQNEIRHILGESMSSIKKYPTVVQGLALGMGLGLGLINGGSEGTVNKFWAPVLGGDGASSSVDMILALGWEKGCDRWGQKLLAKLVAGLGRTGPAACVSLSYLLSSSLHHLSPLAATYSSQVHAALSGKLLVPQVEEYLSLHPSTRVLVITYDASTIPNANLEPIRELKRVLGGSPKAPFKVVSVIGGAVDGDESHLLPKQSKSNGTVSRTSSISTVKTNNSSRTTTSGGYRTTPISSRSYRTASYTSEPERAHTKPSRTVTPPPAPAIDEKTILRRKELAAISDVMIIDRGRDEAGFEDNVKKLSALLREREEFTGSYKGRQEPGARGDELSSASESEENETSEEEEEEEEDDEDETTYSEAMVSVGIVANGNGKSHSGGTWSKMSWGRDLLGKKKQQPAPNLPGGKAYRLLGLDS